MSANLAPLIMKSIKAKCFNGQKVDEDNNGVFPFYDDDTRKSVNVSLIMQTCATCGEVFRAIDYRNHARTCPRLAHWTNYLLTMKPAM